MALYDSIDINFSWEGDFIIGQDGDLEDTSSDLLLSLVNEVRDIAKGSYGDWEKHPNITAALDDFHGEPNTRRNAQIMRSRLQSKLVAAGIVRSEDLSIRIIPVHIHQVLIAINIAAVATSQNRLKVGDPLSISFVYDSNEDKVFFVPKDTDNTRGGNF